MSEARLMRGLSVEQRPDEADSPCQGEMSRRDKGGRDHRALHGCRFSVGAAVLSGPKAPYGTEKARRTRGAMCRKNDHPI